MRTRAYGLALIGTLFCVATLLPSAHAGPLDEFKADCEEIGFTPKTEKYADCVLKLHGRAEQGEQEQAAVSEPVAPVRELPKQSVNVAAPLSEVEKRKLAAEERRLAAEERILQTKLEIIRATATATARQQQELIGLQRQQLLVQQQANAEQRAQRDSKAWGDFLGELSDIVSQNGRWAPRVLPSRDRDSFRHLDCMDLGSGMTRCRPR